MHKFRSKHTQVTSCCPSVVRSKIEEKKETFLLKRLFNAIAVVTENANGSFWLTGAGMGQPNRLDSLRHLTMPRFNTKKGLEIENSILISDAFLPMPDTVTVAAKAGIKAIIQTGGSIKDPDVIKEADRLKVAMVTTSIRHFKH